MSKKLETMTVEELMAEADKLIRQLDSEIINDLEETHRSKLEEHAQNLKNIKAGTQDKTGKQKTSETGSVAEGMHEAILDIVKAFQEFDIDVS